MSPESQSRKTGCLHVVLYVEHPWGCGGGGGACPISITGMKVGEAMQGHGSTCDCTFNVLLHIALYVFCILCVCAWRGILLCFTPPDFSGVPRLVWGTQFFSCLPSMVYPPLPALDSSPFFSMKRGPAAVSLLPKTIFLQVRLLFSTWHFFFLSVKRHCPGWGARGSSPGVGGPRGHPGIRESRRARLRGTLSYLKD